MAGRSDDVFAALLGNGDPKPPPFLIVAAHPDDDVLGAGGRIPALSRALHVVYVTDGAPRDSSAVDPVSTHARELYAERRSAEAKAALELAGVPSRRIHRIGEVDQESALHLTRVSRALAELVTFLRPAGILTHAYEGGHPDHDATAFAVHAASAIVSNAGSEAPTIFEFAGYHEKAGERVIGEFPSSLPESVRLELSPEALHTKRLMLDCHRSQREVISELSTSWECYRPAPAYEFTRGGLHPIYYERFPWKMSGRRFQALARQALAELSLESLC